MTVAEWKRQMTALMESMPDFSHGHLVVERNAAGNLSVLTERDGEWLGYIDVLYPEDSQPPTAIASR